MHKYFIKTPWIVKQIFPSYIWDLPSDEKTVYLTFDDGPHPTVTPWVLEELKKYNAAATFFCIGNNVEKHPGVYQRILSEGHAVANHTFNHVNGWHTTKEKYLEEVEATAALVKSNLFRPPYGRIKTKQAKLISPAYKIVMWDVLSGDFDPLFSPKQCLDNVLDHVGPGSIIVFHDSEKAFPNLRYALPGALEFLTVNGYMLKKIEL
jgi:peptidoglycan/xylan/chitin deacetylase (PgdA/CDA1 family)